MSDPKLVRAKRELLFEKWHGAGNDFVVGDARPAGSWHDVLRDGGEAVARIAREACDRHFGIGADGLLLAVDDPDHGGRARSRIAMRMWNPDGSESEMCGNGLRCFGAWLHARGEFAPGSHRVTTGAGVLTVAIGEDGQISVDMGRPRLSASAIPVLRSPGVRAEDPLGVTSIFVPGWGGVGAEEIVATCVSMGNPHAVVLVPDAHDVPLETFGPTVERHGAFPRRTNVEVCHVVDRRSIVARVWERGAGVTLACGTGACAVMVVARLHGLVDPVAEIRLPGGTLVAEWFGAPGDVGHAVSLSGPAVRTFVGTWFGA